MSARHRQLDDVRQPAGTRRVGHALDELTLNTDGAQGALDAVRADRRIQRIRLATFDLSPEVLQAVGDGRIQFAVDQQAYLQGFLPITLLTQRVRYGLFPARGGVIPTGPSFVTRATAGQVLRLSNRGIR